MDFLKQAQREVLARHGSAAGELLTRGLGPGVHVNRPLSNMAMLLTNEGMIADACMPVMPVSKPSDSYFKFKPEAMFSVPANALVGNEGLPGRPAFGLDTAGTFACQTYGLMDFVSTDEEMSADDPLAPLQDSLAFTRNFLDLAREIRVAAVVHGSGNYGSNTAALTGADRWDQSTSDPVAKLDLALRTPLVRPDTMVIGEEAWDALRSHPKLIQYVISRPSSANGQTPLRVDEATVAAAFRLRQVLVGSAKYNSAVEGQTASYSFVWGKSCALIKVDPNAGSRRTSTFAKTMRFGSWEVRSIFDEKPGRAGGTYLKVTHCDAEEVIAGSNAGYLYTTVIS